MSEGTLASAVAVPDPDTVRQSPEFPAKRRKSSVAEHEPKRRRLSAQGELSPQSQRRRPSSPGPAQDERTERKPARRGGREEERKRGQRLFGALLGTLSQSSPSAAQKRRADIEKRQQDKLKSQADEYDELKKRRNERREVIRKKEKPFYEREVMQTRHSNLVATAHFLKTRTEPVLYYKPWQLRSGDEDVIREQVEEAEATVAREVAEFDARYPPEAFERDELEPILASQDEQEQPAEHRDLERQPQTEAAPEKPPIAKPEAASKESQGTTETVGEQTNRDQASRTDTSPTNGNNTPTGHEQDDVHRGADDDGGEVEEDNEDTVIY
ncbi:uncharacterized protein N7459_004781 [Penicillium hispanicum]|uniref:uncharacterized protein n=1 Tax=Penicillium hispanicum TaxID=1080232 RepID=UPI0025411A75|nr:uncharacterized protein N7459_004781 [Penicillium hispanicum]KAJ5584981.1 hypothetical protein N7459_004781 [Penicillium hispanicum]